MANEPCDGAHLTPLLNLSFAELQTEIMAEAGLPSQPRRKKVKKARHRQLRAAAREGSSLTNPHPTAKEAQPQLKQRHTSRPAKSRRPKVKNPSSPILVAMQELKELAKSGQFADAPPKGSKRMGNWWFVAAVLYVESGGQQTPTRHDVHAAMETTWTQPKIDHARMVERQKDNRDIKRLKGKAAAGEIKVPEDADAHFWSALCREQRLKKREKKLQRRERNKKGGEGVCQKSKAGTGEQAATGCGDLNGMNRDGQSALANSGANNSRPIPQQQMADFNWEAMVEDFAARMNLGN
ncbi:hypothetical protein P154DRAFT_580261 [Amniculicola lignicola CBS 123094]|uniref:Uncharacterized protein n=1 Tax=Amniculicola lignicola CBS 123094 TaxID=1392246 RepID=A0A6A5W5A9_9PLEO|nr:hypothetical protein P154DRAFT_580261 [Amniculicola lignicola CBS 123094]